MTDRYYTDDDKVRHLVQGTGVFRISDHLPVRMTNDRNTGTPSMNRRTQGPGNRFFNFIVTVEVS